MISLRILAVISGEYGRRNVANIRSHAPDGWQVETWQAPAVLPPVIDYPEDYLPESLPPTDLILSFAEQRGVAELLPDIAAMTGAQALVAAVDNEAWLPAGLARQLREWLARINVMCATPKPLCSLTESDFEIARGKRLPHFSPLIAEFARYFGQPDLQLELDPESGQVLSAEVQARRSVRLRPAGGGTPGGSYARPRWLKKPVYCTTITPAWPAWSSCPITITTR